MELHQHDLGTTILELQYGTCIKLVDKKSRRSTRIKPERKLGENLSFKPGQANCARILISV